MVVPTMIPAMKRMMLRTVVLLQYVSNVIGFRIVRRQARAPEQSRRCRAGPVSLQAWPR
jgi:hypothetical protein